MVRLGTKYYKIINSYLFNIKIYCVNFSNFRVKKIDFHFALISFQIKHVFKKTIYPANISCDKIIIIVARNAVIDFI